MTRNAKLTGLLMLAGGLVGGSHGAAAPLSAQTAGDPIVRLWAYPDELEMRVGDEVRVTIAAYTRSGPGWRIRWCAWWGRVRR